MLINVKMPTIVGIVCILTLMRRINFVLSGVGHGKSFIASGPVIKTKVDIIAKHMRFCTYYYYCTDEDLDQNLGLWFSWISLYGRLLKASVQCEKKSYVLVHSPKEIFSCPTYCRLCSSGCNL